MTTASKGKSETGGLEAASDAIWGKRSLSERFGDASGKELQSKIFDMYEAGNTYCFNCLFDVSCDLLIDFSSCRLLV